MNTPDRSGPSRIDIAVCTFRRPYVEATLRSLGALRVPEGWQPHIIVVDNDDGPSAKDLVARVADDLPFEVDYVHAPGRNISIARNAALDASNARFFAFVDDDETATPGWLVALVETQARESADAVLGPVDPIYRPEAPAWMRDGAFHQTRPVTVDGRILTGYTCNVLIDRSTPAQRQRRFRVELGRSGGEDTVYFYGLTGAGGRMAYAPGALLLEPVPESRESFGWLYRRRYRSGQTHGRLMRERGLTPAATAIEIARAGVKAALCFAVAVPLFVSPVRGRAALLRGALHAGVVSALLGSRDLQLYGQANGADVPSA